MTPEPLTLAKRVAAEIRAEMGWQNKSVRDLAAALQIDYRTAKARYKGEQEFKLDEVPSVAAWLNVSTGQLTTGVRDRDVEHAA